MEIMLRWFIIHLTILRTFQRRWKIFTWGNTFHEDSTHVVFSPCSRFNFKWMPVTLEEYVYICITVCNSYLKTAVIIGVATTRAFITGLIDFMQQDSLQTWPAQYANHTASAQEKHSFTLSRGKMHFVCCVFWWLLMFSGWSSKGSQ